MPIRRDASTDSAKSWSSDSSKEDNKDTKESENEVEKAVIGSLAAVYGYEGGNWQAVDGGSSKVFIFYHRQLDLYRIIAATTKDGQVYPICLIAGGSKQLLISCCSMW